MDAMHYLSAGAVCFARAVNHTPKIAAVALATGARGSSWSVVSVAGAMIGADDVARGSGAQFSDLSADSPSALGGSVRDLNVLPNATNDFDRQVVASTGEELRCLSLDTIQVNVGLKCNMACVHCHVSSSPLRTEMMDWPVMEMVLRAAKTVNAHLVDITGGAPEMNPYLRRFIKSARAQGHAVQVRTNLTVLVEPDFETVAEFFRQHQVRLVASLPCYLEENVRAQRGADAYEKSIQVLKTLNALGYGSDPSLPLDLVYNPVGAFLPPNQAALEADYHRELSERFGIIFTRLLTITNMPIGRFFDDLQRHNKHAKYIQLLRDSFNPQTLDRLMCRHQIEVDWDGTVYDCDFNLALNLPVANGAPGNIRDFDPGRLTRRRIVSGSHCFGCTAGHGSSCGGALV